MEGCLECGKDVAVSVLGRGNVAGEANGGVLVVVGRGCLTPVGSVVLRDAGG